MRVKIRAYFSIFALNPIKAKQKIEKKLEKTDAMAWQFHYLSFNCIVKNKSSSGWYKVSFDVSFIRRDYTNSQDVDDIINQFCKIEYFTGIKLLEISGS